MAASGTNFTLTPPKQRAHLPAALGEQQDSKSHRPFELWVSVNFPGPLASKPEPELVRRRPALYLGGACLLEQAHSTPTPTPTHHRARPQGHSGPVASRQRQRGRARQRAQSLPGGSPCSEAATGQEWAWAWTRAGREPAARPSSATEPDRRGGGGLPLGQRHPHISQSASQRAVNGSPHTVASPLSTARQAQHTAEETREERGPPWGEETFFFFCHWCEVGTYPHQRVAHWAPPRY